MPPAILKGFATIIRVAARISHQPWRSPCQKRKNPRYAKNPDPCRKSTQNPDLSSCTHFHTRLVVPRCAGTLQIHSDFEYDSKYCEKCIFQVQIRVQNHACGIFSKNNTPLGQPTPGGALSPAGLVLVTKCLFLTKCVITKCLILSEMIT